MMMMPVGLLLMSIRSQGYMSRMLVQLAKAIQRPTCNFSGEEWEEMVI